MTRADENLGVVNPLAATGSIYLQCSSFIDYAAHYWSECAWGEAMETTLERQCFALLNAPKALCRPISRCSLNILDHGPIHGCLSFAMTHVLKAIFRNVTDRSKQASQLFSPLDTLSSTSPAVQISSPKRNRTLSFWHGVSSPTH